MPLLHRAICVIELGCAKVSSDTDESGIEPNSPRSIIPSQCLTPNVYNFDLFQLNSVTGRLNCDTNSPNPILFESIPVSALTLGVRVAETLLAPYTGFEPASPCGPTVFKTAPSPPGHTACMGSCDPTNINFQRPRSAQAVHSTQQRPR